MSSTTPARLRSALFHALRSAFRALPIDEARRDAWRQRFFDRFPSIRPTATRGMPWGQVGHICTRLRIHIAIGCRTSVERRMDATQTVDRLVFINAWNEWAEGATLEPDARLGHVGFMRLAAHCKAR